MERACGVKIAIIIFLFSPPFSDIADEFFPDISRVITWF